MSNKSNSNGQQQIVLWGVTVSPFVRKTMISLEEKGLAYEQREVLPKIMLKATGQAVPHDFDLASPLGKIPAIKVGDFCLADSAVIAKYLDAKFPNHPRLYPTSPEDYARALWFENYSDNNLTEVIYKKVFLECIAKPKVLNIATDHAIVAEAIDHEVPKVLSYLNDELATNDWFAGEFSMADIAITTQLLALKMSGFEIDKRFENLHRFLNKITKRSSLQKLI
jgi:glutathione S-transferase